MAVAAKRIYVNVYWYGSELFGIVSISIEMFYHISVHFRLMSTHISLTINFRNVQPFFFVKNININYGNSILIQYIFTA